MEQNTNMNINEVQNEIETNLLRFMQIRDDFYNAVKEIQPSVAQLKETNKSLVSHFDVLRQISKNTEDNIQVVIKSAAKDMGHAEFSHLIDDILKASIKDLDQSIVHAKRILNETLKTKYIKLVFASITGCLLFGLAGFGVGYAYSKKHTYALPNNFVSTYVVGLETRHKRLQEEQKKNKGRGRK
jgi:hypothetical protein